MATYNSSKITAGAPARANAGETILHGTVTLTAAAANSDIVKFFKAPAGFIVSDVILSSTDIDTNGSPTVTIDVGDADDVDKLIDGSTIGRAGGIDRMNVTTGMQYTYTADTEVYATILTVATGATGTIKLTMIGTLSQ